MKNRIVFGAVLLALSMGGAQAGTNTNFSCDVSTSTCTCDPNFPGDCDAMKKNCVGGQILSCSGTVIIICKCASTRTNGLTKGGDISRKAKGVLQPQ